MCTSCFFAEHGPAAALGSAIHSHTPAPPTWRRPQHRSPTHCTRCPRVPRACVHARAPPTTTAPACPCTTTTTHSAQLCSSDSMQGPKRGLPGPLHPHRLLLHAAWRATERTTHLDRGRTGHAHGHACVRAEEFRRGEGVMCLGSSLHRHLPRPCLHACLQGLDAQPRWCGWALASGSMDGHTRVARTQTRPALPTLPPPAAAAAAAILLAARGAGAAQRAVAHDLHPVRE